MGKSLLYRLFGLGSIPKRRLPELQREGIVLVDEGLGGSITFRNFKAPGKRYSWRRNWFVGSLVLTGRRFVAFAFSKPIVDVPIGEDRVDGLWCRLEGEKDLLVVQFDASAFNERWSGSVECRFSTSQAYRFFERLPEYAAARGG